MKLPSRQWLHFALVVALAIGIAGFVQAIAERHSLRWDLTPMQSYSLSEVSQKLLGLMPDPIEATAFTSRDDVGKVTDLMRLFQGAAPNFRYEILDLDRHPGRAREAGVDRYGKAVIRYQGRDVVVDAQREQSVTAGLTLLKRGRATRIAFLEGHGERALDDVSAPIGYGELRQALARESYEVDRVNLMNAGELDAKAVDLVIVAGPKNDLLEAETEALDRYLAGGGHVALLIDPVPLPNLARFAARHGIESPLDIVVDRSNQIFGADPFHVRIPTYERHPITGSSTTPALFAVARSVDANKAFTGAKAESVASSLPDAWATRDFERATRAGEPPRPKEDREGPVPVMAAASWSTEAGEARLVVVGDSDFAANSMLGLLGNRDLVLNAVGWSVSAGELVAARPPSEVMALRPLSPLVLTTRTGHAIFLALVILEPALVLAIGTTIALRRRWRG